MSRVPLSPHDVQSFLESLPAHYRQHVDHGATIAHAHLSGTRDGRPALIGSFDSRRPDTQALCVVADDRAGLLAGISAALVLSELDVIDAELYRRELAPGKYEAIDLFWVKRASGDASPLTDDEVKQLETALVRLLSGELLAPPAEQPARGPAGRQRDTIVRFLGDEDGSFSTLEVEAPDHPGLLLALSQALFAQRLQIVSSEVKTKDGEIFDRFMVTEQDGSSVAPERRLEVQVAVLSALEKTLRC